MSADSIIVTESGVSLFDGKPFVALRWRGESCQFSPQEARTFALHVIETADAAVTESLAP